MSLRAFLPLALTAFLLPCVNAQAASSDRDKPIEIQAAQFQGDEVKQTAVYSGGVVLTQGTLRVTGDRLDVRILPDGWRVITIKGRPVTMKEKRDGADAKTEEWVHARAMTCVWNEEDDTITLTTDAKLERTVNGTIKDSTAGSRIIYNMRTSQSRVESAPVASDGKKERVSTVLAPRQKRGE